MKTKRGIPIKAKPFTWLRTTTSGHGWISDEQNLVVVINGGDRVTARVSRECELALGMITSYIGLKTRITTTRASAKWILDLYAPTCFLASLCCDGGVRERDIYEYK